MTDPRNAHIRSIAVVGHIHPTAVIGGPPEHREHIWRYYAGASGTYGPAAFFQPIIEPTVIVQAFCTIDAGIRLPTRIGHRSFLMARCHVAHDVQIGRDCELGAGVVVCGEVEIGNEVRIGGNTWIRPLIKIGDGARIGGGAVVVKDVPAGAVVAGNPARPLTKGREATARGQAGLQFPEGKHGTAAQVDYDPHFHPPVHA